VAGAKVLVPELSRASETGTGFAVMADEPAGMEITSVSERLGHPSARAGKFSVSTVQLLSTTRKLKHCGALAQLISDDILIAVMQRFGLFLICIAAVGLQPGASIEQIAGTGTEGFSGDGGPALQARFHGVYSIAVNANETAVYVADLENRRIRRINLKSDIITTVAGNGTRGVPEDGAVATQSPLIDPRAVAVDDRENVYILERGGNALRVAGRDGKIKTLIGPNAVPAPLNGPKDLCVDRYGAIIIADAENNLVRRFDLKTSTLSTIVGAGEKGDRLVPSDPLATEVFRPHGVRMGPGGDLIITDSYNHRVLRLRRRP